MKDGVIADFEVTEKMLQHFYPQGPQRRWWVRRALSRRARRNHPGRTAGSRRRGISGEGIKGLFGCRAMAARDRRRTPDHRAVRKRDRGHRGGTTDIAISAGIVYSRAVRVAGNELDEAIIQYIKRKYNLLIGERTARSIKIELGSAWPAKNRFDGNQRTQLDRRCSSH